MDSRNENAQPHVVPSYKAPSDVTWYHFLHGNVPGHQIDFMYRAEVPQGPLTRQHFSHLSRIMKYIEPQASAPYAFAIANLSRDDTQHEPGRGGLAMIFGHRVQGTRDHAGRQDPPFAHGIAAVNREFTSAALLSVALSFHRSVLGGEPTYNCPSSLMYREYVRRLVEESDGVPEVLRTYLSSFRALPRPPESTLSLRWVTGGAIQPKRVIIVHPDGAPFSAVAACASKIAGVLYPSDVRWTSITSGREMEVENGVTIRLVAHLDASSSSSEERVIRMSDVPEDDAGIAKLLFNAAPLVLRSYSTAPVEGWKRQARRGFGSPPAAEPRASSSSRAEEPTAALEARQETERTCPSGAVAEASTGHSEGEATSGDKLGAPSHAGTAESDNESSADEGVRSASTPGAVPAQGAPSAPPGPEPSRGAEKDQIGAPREGDDLDLRPPFVPRRSRPWLPVSMVLVGAAAAPFLYASWDRLAFENGPDTDGPSSPSEPANSVSRAEPSDPVGPDPSGGASVSGAVGEPMGSAPPQTRTRSRKASGAKPSPPSSSPPPPGSASPPSMSAPSPAGPSIIGAPPVFVSSADGKQ